MHYSGKPELELKFWLSATEEVFFTSHTRLANQSFKTSRNITSYQLTWQPGMGLTPLQSSIRFDGIRTLDISTVRRVLSLLDHSFRFFGVANVFSINAGEIEVLCRRIFNIAC